MPATYFPFRWMAGTFQEILASSSGNSARIKSMTYLRVFSFTGSTEAKYSSTEWNLGDFSSFRLPFVGRFFLERVQAPNDEAQLLANAFKVGYTEWTGPITLNVVHESPTKSSAR
jgi:hypothetical protein